MGPNAARNRGAVETRSEWLAFVDDDDLWAPTKLARQVGVATDGGSQWVYAGSVNVDDDLWIIHGRAPPDAEGRHGDPAAFQRYPRRRFQCHRSPSA